MQQAQVRLSSDTSRSDHGKSTLANNLLQLSATKQLADRALDHNDLEKERGITIFAKNAATVWK